MHARTPAHTRTHTHARTRTHTLKRVRLPAFNARRSVIRFIQFSYQVQRAHLEQPRGQRLRAFGSDSGCDSAAAWLLAVGRGREGEGEGEREGERGCVWEGR